MMKPRKPKNEPSLRDKLSANFMKAFEEDFSANGVGVIEQLREKHPDKYAELAAKLIASASPPVSVFAEAKSMDDIAHGLLKQVGIDNPSERQLEAALKLHDKFIQELEMIAAVDIAIGMAEEEFEYRELRP